MERKPDWLPGFPVQIYCNSEVNTLTEKESLLLAFENEILPKIYGFCKLKMSTDADVEDLSQDICLEVLKAIHSSKKIEDFNAFVWSVSNHTLCNWMRKKKHGTTAYLTELVASDDNVEEEYV